VAEDGEAARAGEGAQLIRATDPRAFRYCMWARLAGTVDDPETGRRCYLAEFADGMTVLWPVDDEARGYQFLGTGQVAEQATVFGTVLLRAVTPVLGGFARAVHDAHRALFPREHRRCRTCRPPRGPGLLAVDGREYRRRLKARRRRKRRH
jgi:hypothetical protein